MSKRKQKERSFSRNIIRRFLGRGEVHILTPRKTESGIYIWKSSKNTIFNEHPVPPAKPFMSFTTEILYVNSLDPSPSSTPEFILAQLDARFWRHQSSFNSSLIHKIPLLQAAAPARNHFFHPQHGLLGMQSIHCLLNATYLYSQLQKKKKFIKNHTGFPNNKVHMVMSSHCDSLLREWL